LAVVLVAIRANGIVVFEAETERIEHRMARLALARGGALLEQLAIRQRAALAVGRRGICVGRRWGSLLAEQA
jgi:hypothetical protein